MYNLDHHGGECCGRHHLYHFWDFPCERAVRTVKARLADTRDWEDEESTYGDLCVEVALADYQFNTKPRLKRRFDHASDEHFPVDEKDEYWGKTWHQVLTETLGFRQVYEFQNPNTGNIVRVYFYCNSEV